MDVPLVPPRRAGGGRVVLTAVALIATICSHGAAASIDAQTASDVAVKAAFLYNFAKFVEWPALLPGAPIVACVVGDDDIAAALVKTVSGQNISGHALDVTSPREIAGWTLCQVLFIADADPRRNAEGLRDVRALPVLTVSDGKGFTQAGGIIELFVDGGKMRFAINVDAAERSGLHLSSRLLKLARLTRDEHVGSSRVDLQACKLEYSIVSPK